MGVANATYVPLRMDTRIQQGSAWLNLPLTGIQEKQVKIDVRVGIVRRQQQVSSEFAGCSSHVAGQIPIHANSKQITSLLF